VARGSVVISPRKLKRAKIVESYALLWIRLRCRAVVHTEFSVCELEERSSATASQSQFDAQCCLSDSESRTLNTLPLVRYPSLFLSWMLNHSIFSMKTPSKWILYRISKKVSQRTELVTYVELRSPTCIPTITSPYESLVTSSLTVTGTDASMIAQY
jgi:hypothetical protein